ncbi:MAG: CoA transferase [Dehalococcoidia bacterium]|nr:CoA transferase [Dehalococcoidia bacterium]
MTDLNLPLKGIRVVDLTVVLAGPYCGMILADFGAEVIRVESIQHFPPQTRGIFARPSKDMPSSRSAGYPNGEPGRRPWNRYPLFNAMGRNKLSMTVDITKPDGMEVFKRLVKVSDVVLENYVPEVMDKLGVSYEMLKQVRPDIIFCKMSAYGDTGPYRNFRAMAQSIDVMLGHGSIRGYADSDSTDQPASVAEDPAEGVQAAFAIVAALYHRNRTGEGQLLDLCLSESYMPYMPQAFMDYAMNGRVQGTLGNRDPVAVPCGNFRCKGNDKWVSISIFTDEEWDGFCRVVNEEWVHDDRFKDSVSRRRNEDELERLVGSWTQKHDSYEVMHLLQKEGVAVGPLLDEVEAYQDPQLKARGFFVEESQEDAGTHMYPGSLFKMSGTPPLVRRGPVRLGEDNEYVYNEVLGIGGAEYEKLVETGHIGTEYAPHIK